MGLNNLLPNLKECRYYTKLYDYRGQGQRAGIDTYIWYFSFYSGSTKSSKAPVVSPSSKEGKTSLSLFAKLLIESTNYDVVVSSRSLFLTAQLFPTKKTQNKREESKLFFNLDAVKRTTSKPRS